MMDNGDGVVENLNTQTHSLSTNNMNLNISTNHTSQPTNLGCELEDSYCIYLDIPGISEQIKIQVGNNDSVFELKQMIMESMDTSLRTCFSLVINGIGQIDEYAKISEIQGIHDGVIIRLIDEPYNLREAIIHINRFNNVVISSTSTSKENTFFNTNDGLSPTCLSEILGYSCDLNEPSDLKLDDKDINDVVEYEPSILLLLSPIINQRNGIKCLNDIQVAPWNPPIGPRKLSGDLLYLIIQTLEGKTLYITCCVNGFFINRSDDQNFDPLPIRDSYRAYTLVGLLSQISDRFKSNFSKLIRQYVKKNVYDFAQAPILESKLWTVPYPTNEKNSLKSYELLSSVVGVDDIHNGQLRDWNEEYQVVKQLKKDDITERIVRDRSIHRVVVDMAYTACKGVRLLVEGCIRPMNPQEKLKDQLFVWNNLFFSISSDTKGYFKGLGGELATKSATMLDLHGVDILNRLNIDGIYNLGTTVVDHYGYRILVQSIIPGIFQRNSDDIVVYGVMESNISSIKNNEYFSKSLESFKQQLKIRPSTFISPNDGLEVTLNTSIESKGIVGSDGRHYLIDLYKTLPPDPLYIDEKLEFNKYLPTDFVYASKYAQTTYNYCFPQQRFSNKIRVFRESFVDEFYAKEYLKFTNTKKNELDNLVASAFDELKSNNTNNNNVNISLSNEKLHELNECATRKAALICSYSEVSNGYDIMISPDCFNTRVDMKADQLELMKKDRAMCHKMSHYLVSSFIPEIISRIHRFTLFSGDSLTKLFHSKGINMRYLGYFDALITSSPQQFIHYIHRICVNEMIIRATKNHLRSILSSNARKYSVGQIISHYLNCFLGSYQTPKAIIYKDEIKINRRGKRKNKNNNANNLDTKYENVSNWANLTPVSLWNIINNAVSDKYGYQIDCSGIAQLKEKYKITCASLLRRFCQIYAIKIVSRDYDFTSSKHHTFYVDDIIDISPIVKTINVTSVDALDAINMAKEYIATNNKSLLKLAYDILTAVSTHLVQIYGLIHPQLAVVHELLAKICYLQYEVSSAVYYQKKAVLINERYHGLDHHYTIHSYVNLGLYYFNCKNIISGIKTMNRAKYLITLAYGSDHPEIVTVDTNLALMLSIIGKNETSITLLENVVGVLKIWFPSIQPINFAIVSLLLAKQQVICSYYKDAIASAKDAFKLFKTLNGIKHHFTIEASVVMEKATKLAVTSQRLSKAITGQTYVDNSKKDLLYTNTDGFDLIKVVNDLKIGSEEVLIDRNLDINNQRCSASSSSKPTKPIEIDVD